VEIVGEGKVCVSVSKELYERAKRFVEEQGGFSSVEELVEFLLKEAIPLESSAGLSKEEEERVKERLRALGYI